MVKKKVTLSIDSKSYSDFQKYCDDNAVMLSKRIEIFMRNEVDWYEKGIDRRRKR